MKSLILFLTLTCVCNVAWAQEVEVAVLVSPFEEETQVLVSPKVESLDVWRDVKNPNMIAYPVELNVDITRSPATLSATDAAQISALVEYTAPAAGGAIVVVGSDGRVLKKYSLGQNGSRVLIEIPVSAGQVRYVTPFIREDMQVSVTRLYIEPVSQLLRDFGFGTSAECHPNAACEDFKEYSDQLRSAVRMRIVLEEGIGWCTGTLVNNTALDGTPYILSAEHCLADFTPMMDLWRFDFNYQSSSCDNPGAEPKFDSMTGCVLRAKARDTDFLLLELIETIPVRYDVHFSGWDRSMDVDPGQVVLIHHPSGDIKKISRDRNATFVWDKVLDWDEGYSTPANTHWRTRLDEGAFEGGSSGGGLYTQSGYLIGQLHGGSGDCSSNTAYSGAISVSWDYGSVDGRLQEWLDPLLEGTVILDGMEHPDVDNVYNLTGTVLDPNGQPVTDVRITVNGPENVLLEVDSAGNFSLGQLPRTDTLYISPRKNGGDPANGVSATDLLLIKQHLLGTRPFTLPYQSIAADATGNGVLSAGDILILQKLLLGLVQELPSKPAWDFFPNEIRIGNPADSVVNVQFVAIKMGDVNGTADPKK